MHITTRLHRLPAAICVAACLCMSAIAVADGVSDRDITLAIETDLAVDDAVQAHRVDVTTKQGIVTLSGSVDNILAKSRALERAMAIKGVRSVVNRIAVDAPERPDGDVRQDVKSALRADPATDSYELDVAVADGDVTLKGTVDSWQEKRLSETVAQGVRGVTSVKNRIGVEPKIKRSDYEVTADIEQRLAMSVWVDARFLDVDVKEGRVTLSGTVGSELERRRAAALAWVSGVTDVAVDDVETNWWAEDRMRRTERYPVPSDKEIAGAVESAMYYDPRVFAFDLDAQVRNGVVTLTGTVDNLKAKRAAVQNARNTIGVWRVRDHLHVRPTTMPHDTKIAADVRAALARDPYVERYDVGVDVIGGRVYLSGSVNTSFEQEQAKDVASRVNGVIDVRNGIRHDHEWTRLSDREIMDDVKWQLFWSPFVDSGDITVAVEDGVVTLTGTVADWAEWRDAAENAFEGNAKDVRNKLKIAGG